MQEKQSIESIESEFGKLPSNFELIEIAGRGGAGIVLRARDTLMQRDVAIKILFKSTNPESSTADRFSREAKLLAGLDHQNIVKIYSSGSTDRESRFHVMEWINGISLAEQLNATPKLPDLMFYEIFIQMLSALKYSHSRNVVHRDLKPSNIMLCSDKKDTKTASFAKLLDFGIARQIESENGNITKTGVFVGTPLYMSPEQCSGAQQLSSSDIYSIACVMYQCITGKPLFEGDSAMDIMYKQLHTDAPKLPLSLSSEKLSLLIGRCLEKDPSLRPDAGEVLAQLKEIHAEFSGKISSSVSALGSKPKLIQFTFIVALCLIGSGYFLLNIRWPATKTAPVNESDRRAMAFEKDRLAALESLNRKIKIEKKNLHSTMSVEETREKQFNLCDSLYNKLELLEGESVDTVKRSKQINAVCTEIMSVLKECDPHEQSVMRVRILMKFFDLAAGNSDIDAALNYQNQALKCALDSENSAICSDVLSSQASFLLRLKRFDKAQESLDKAMAIWRKSESFGKNTPDLNDGNVKANSTGASISDFGLSRGCDHEQQIQALKFMIQLSQFLIDQDAARLASSSISRMVSLKAHIEPSSPADQDLIKQSEILEANWSKSELSHRTKFQKTPIENMFPAP